MPGVVDEVGQTARGVVSALSSAPVILAFVLLQAGVLGMLGWYSHERTQSNDKLIAMYHQQFETLLERCTGFNPERLPDAEKQ